MRNNLYSWHTGGLNVKSSRSLADGKQVVRRLTPLICSKIAYRLINVIVIVQADFQVLQYVEHVITIVRQYLQYRLTSVY
jgi:hypothetical protein